MIQSLPKKVKRDLGNLAKARTSFWSVLAGFKAGLSSDWVVSNLPQKVASEASCGAPGGKIDGVSREFRGAERSLPTSQEAPVRPRAS